MQDGADDFPRKSRRVELHGRIAEALETDFADPVRNLGAAIPLWQKTGELAVRRFARHEALAPLQKVRSLVEQLSPSPERGVLELRPP